MNNFVSIIKRSDFNDLYKYGHLYVHDMIPFEGNIAEHADDKVLFEALTQHMNTYEYSTEYLVITVRKAPFLGTSDEVFVKDVLAVYALDEDAKKSLSVSLDPRINIQVSCWNNNFVVLNKKQQIRQAKAGMFNCYEIFNLSTEERSRVKSLLPANLIEDVFDELYSRKRPSGQKSIWHYLLRYERHSPYWNDARGFFSDAVHAFENYKAQKEIDYDIADELPVGDIICGCKDDFMETYHKVFTSANCEYNIPGCDYLAVAPLFLFMHSLFREGGISPSKLSTNELLANNYLHTQFTQNFAIAVGLLGIVLGQDNTYSCYYEIKRLNIFNRMNNEVQSSKNEISICNPVTGQNISKEEAEILISKLYSELSELKSSNTSKELLGANAELNNQSIEESKAINTTIDDVPHLDNKNHIEELPSSDSLVDADISTSTVSDTEGIPNDAQEDYFEPICMRKFKKGRKEFNQRAKPIWARSIEEYKRYQSQDYEREDFFSRV